MTRTCDKCGSERIHWRCTNDLENTQKFKCLDCGNIIIEQKAESVIDENKYEQFRQKMKSIPLKPKTKQELPKKEKKKPMKKKEHKKPKNYTKMQSGSYAIHKVKNGKYYYCGTCGTEEQAKNIVARMRENNWDMKKLEKIREEVLFK